MIKAASGEMIFDNFSLMPHMQLNSLVMQQLCGILGSIIKNFSRLECISSILNMRTVLIWPTIYTPNNQMRIIWGVAYVAL